MPSSSRPALTAILGFGLLLTIIFTLMKLSGEGFAAGWPWWTVTAPLWMPLATVAGLVILSLSLPRLLRMLGRLLRGLF